MFLKVFDEHKTLSFMSFAHCQSYKLSGKLRLVLAVRSMLWDWVWSFLGFILILTWLLLLQLASTRVHRMLLQLQGGSKTIAFLPYSFHSHSLLWPLDLMSPFIPSLTHYKTIRHPTACLLHSESEQNRSSIFEVCLLCGMISKQTILIAGQQYCNRGNCQWVRTSKSKWCTIWKGQGRLRVKYGISGRYPRWPGDITIVTRTTWTTKEDHRKSWREYYNECFILYINLAILSTQTVGPKPA